MPTHTPSDGRDRLHHHHVPRPTTQQHLAIVGQDLHLAAGSGRSALTNALSDDAQALELLTDIPVVAMLIAADNADALTTQIGHLPADIGAVYLTRTEAARARTVQRTLEATSSRAVLTEEDTLATALAAQAVNYLCTQGRTPDRSRVVILGAVHMPVLTPLLIATGFLDITLWKASDASTYSLDRATRDADVVIDLLRHSPASARYALDRTVGSVLSLQGLEGQLFVAPGLLRAVLDTPPTRLKLGIDAYAVCAYALARAIPPRRQLPDLVGDRHQEALMTSSITSALTRATHPRARRRRRIRQLSPPTTPAVTPAPITTEQKKDHG